MNELIPRTGFVPPPEPFSLTPGEQQSALWQRLMGEFNTRLAKLRAENDDGNLDDRQTARKRGRIEEIKTLMALDKPPVITN